MTDSLTLSPVTRFSARADNYSKFRPGYPVEIIPFLQQHTGLKKRFRIADIGAGTGIFSELLLKHGYRVKAVEPNAEMRTVAEKRLNHFSGFSSTNAAAEDTGITSETIDLITVGQAFHWFKPLAVKKEFSRILKPPGHILLAWNILQDSTPFLQAYNALKEKYAPDLKHSLRGNLTGITAFFRPAPVITAAFHHAQLLNSEEFKGYFLSFSTVPLDNEASFDIMMEELDQLFQLYAEDNLLKMEYETRVYLSRMHE